MKSAPGSPLAQAQATKSSKSWRGSTKRTARPSSGRRSAKDGSPEASAAMNSSVKATERLKLVSCPGAPLARMKASTSGWSTRSTPMLAPWRIESGRSTSVARWKRSRKATGPGSCAPAASGVPWAPRGEKSKPVPPPLVCTSAAQRKASKTPATEPSTGSTKHAASWPPAIPALRSAGELGRNSSEEISR
ncbi:MAG: hypothetical protein QM765_09100 [Myxococcales bacterium]